MFAYCGNNPINRKDNGGECWNIVIGAVAGAVIGAVTSIVSQMIDDPNSYKTTEFWEHVAVSSGAGALSGAFAATGIGLPGQIAINTAIGATSGVLDTAIDADYNTQPTDYMISALVGGMLGAAAGYLGGPGSATKHMQSSFTTALGNNNWRYYFTQTLKEAKRAGFQAVNSVIKGMIPTVIRDVIHFIKKEKEEELYE